jgi:hypothetical protein
MAYYAHKHKLPFLPHAGRSTLHRLPRPTLGTVSRARLVESKSFEKALLYNNVSIGDVGYLHQGMFIRMFNVTRPWDDPSNRLVGRPEPYNPLDGGPFTNTIEAQFDEVVLISRFVTAETNAFE